MGTWSGLSDNGSKIQYICSIEASQSAFLCWKTRSRKSLKTDGRETRDVLFCSQHGLAGLLKGSYQETDCPPIDEADLQFTSLPLDLLSKIHTSITTETTKLDKSLLDSLSQVGFKHDPYPAGLLIKFFRYGTPRCFTFETIKRIPTKSTHHDSFQFLSHFMFWSFECFVVSGKVEDTILVWKKSKKSKRMDFKNTFQLIHFL